MSETFRPGTVFAGYLIERVLGSGGMGTVYAAKHPRLPRRDALKVLSQRHSADPQFQRRFIREAELAAQLDHPNIVSVHDRGMTDGRLWIAMQFVDGADAAELVRRGALPPERAVAVIGAAARGLDAAHRAGLLHRDVKPGNILVESRPGGPDRVYITDFGIARAVGDASGLTVTGAILGTFAYTAPEQLSASTVDHRADIYSLGCTLFELLTGTRPFPYTTPVEVIRAQLQDPPPRPSATNPGLPRRIDEVIATAMAKDPAARQSSCGALANAAAAALAPDTATVLVRAARPVSRRRWKYFAVAAAIAVLAAAIVSGLVLTGNSDVVKAPGATTTARRTVSATPPTTSGTVAWGNYSYVVQAFPGLLPATPLDSGYQGLVCAAVGLNGKPIDVNARDPVNELKCNGNWNPVERIRAFCNADRRPTTVEPFDDAVQTGQERWTRPSGSGLVTLNDATKSDGTGTGSLQVQFDDPNRNFCALQIFGGTSGRDLYDRWWVGAPL
ncbi:serine/threonine-protein kinase [Nocardia arthritidis]|uniref:non-specific serine/threonine protein kinase n=1 Tax=Nocardia arthritidis TaxID=228602 RepID=A0A6G9YAY7_9NOCA|nr:serine/threonine-protein kinase [Nocardia arthritidis]QIS10381.1 protein kinase [Nocardia arthritidis]